jgi:ubiquitin carboxyl-terminal hydrolase 9/24
LDLSGEQAVGHLQSDRPRHIPPQTTATTAAFDLLVALCTNCPENLSMLLKCELVNMFSTTERGSGALTEWESPLLEGPRPSDSGCFVGLLNPSKTCFMNSVLQQLFNLEGIRQAIMSSDGKCTDPADEFSGNERSAIEESAAPTYNLQILLHMQDIFRHLSDNQLKYYAPKGIWEDYRMNSEKFDLQMPYDASEFFINLIETGC